MMKFQIHSKKNHPKWQENQILSLFKLKYPDRMLGNSHDGVERRKVFWKDLWNYKLANNNRLTVINSLNKDEEKELEFKIPYLREKDIIVMQAHYEHNHCGRINVINIMH